MSLKHNIKCVLVDSITNDYHAFVYTYNKKDLLEPFKKYVSDMSYIDSLKFIHKQCGALENELKILLRERRKNETKSLQNKICIYYVIKYKSLLVITHPLYSICRTVHLCSFQSAGIN